MNTERRSVEPRPSADFIRIRQLKKRYRKLQKERLKAQRKSEDASDIEQEMHWIEHEAVHAKW